MPSHKGRLVVLSLLRREGQWICLWDREGWDVVLALLTTENQSNSFVLAPPDVASELAPLRGPERGWL